MEVLFEYWYLFILVALTLFSAVYLYFTRPPERKPRESPWSEVKESQFRYLDARLDFDDVRFQVPFDEQPTNWQKKMKSHGEYFRSSALDGIYLVNGTYAGSDPFDLVPLVKTLFPKLPFAVAASIKWIQRKSLDSLVKDCGNFLDDYTRLMQTALQANIPCFNFKWSSGNHHAARLRGAADLVEYLSDHISRNIIPKNGRILLIGHSHAGQVFSLITQMQTRTIRNKLIPVVEELGVPTRDTLRHLKNIRGLSFDFVTLGMPPRYRWFLTEKMRLLHLINHRGNDHRAGSYKGLLHTVDGDYVQQSGIRGTDSYNFVPRLRVANKKLNDILDGGTNVRNWLEDIKLKNRVPRYGYSYLIDYKDMSYDKANLFRTVFGHGTYTETRFMEFNLNVIVDHFYR